MTLYDASAANIFLKQSSKSWNCSFIMSNYMSICHNVFNYIMIILTLIYGFNSFTQMVFKGHCCRFVVWGKGVNINNLSDPSNILRLACVFLKLLWSKEKFPSIKQFLLFLQCLQYLNQTSNFPDGAVHSQTDYSKSLNTFQIADTFWPICIANCFWKHCSKRWISS